MNELFDKYELIEAGVKPLQKRPSEDENKNKKVDSVLTRLKKRRAMQRNKAKLRMGRKRWKNKMPDEKRVEKRAKRRARAEIKNKTKGDSDSFQSRARGEKLANRRNRLIQRLALRKKRDVRRDARGKK